jgi:hypothetical protein
VSALRSLSSPLLLRTEMSAVASVTLVLGVVIAAGPQKVVVTNGSLPLFEVWPDSWSITAARLAWGIAWCAASLALVALSWRATHLWMQVVAWSTAGTSGIWAFGSLWFAIDGRGSAIGAVVFTFPLLWVGFLLIRVVKGSGAQCGSS